MSDQPEEHEFQIQVRTQGDIGVLEWNGPADEDMIYQAVSMATDDVIMGHEIRRVEVQIPAGDTPAKRALHRAGFRLEGVRREAYEFGDDHVDVRLYSRLASDIAYGDGAFSGVMNSVLPKKRMLSHVLFRNRHNKILFLSTHYKDEWELPGGVVEPGESPREGAQREVAEEIGLTLSLHKLLAIDWLPPYLGWDDAMQYVFDGGVLADEQIDMINFVDGEITEAHWVDLEQAAPHLYPAAVDRLRAILADRATSVLYLEAGQNPV